MPRDRRTVGVVVTCPACGQETSDLPFCLHCGGRTTPPEPAAPVAEPSRQDTCPGCGVGRGPGAFCASCGTQLGPATTSGTRRAGEAPHGLNAPAGHAIQGSARGGARPAWLLPVIVGMSVLAIVAAASTALFVVRPALWPGDTETAAAEPALPNTSDDEIPSGGGEPDGEPAVIAPDALAGVAITVGSKDFTENILMGELVVQALERVGADVTNQTNLGGTEVVREALLAGEIDVYPEYNGTGWTVHLANEDPSPTPRNCTASPPRPT